MEPIKITDKLTLRQEAVRMAIMHAEHSDFTEQIIRAAKTYESYLQGNAELPEYVDPQSEHKYFADLLGKFKENTQPKPLGFWISADSEMKPAKGVQVLCALHYAVNNIVYQAMYYSPETKEWYAGADDDNTNHVVAWCPIVPFTQPTL